MTTPERSSGAPPTKAALLAALAVARADVHDAIRGLSAAEAERPMGEGKWSAREVILHLGIRDRVRLEEWNAALAGRPVSWQPLDKHAMVKVNRETLEPVASLEWDTAVRVMDETRRALLEKIEAVPDEPREKWRTEHAFGWMLDALPRHDHHHAQGIRSWRAATARR